MKVKYHKVLNQESPASVAVCVASQAAHISPVTLAGFNSTMKINPSKLNLSLHPQGIVVNGALLIPQAAINEMRDWISDCSLEMFNEIDSFSDIEIARMTERHFDGGLQAFLLTTVN